LKKIGRKTLVNLHKNKNRSFKDWQICIERERKTR